MPGPAKPGGSPPPERPTTGQPERPLDGLVHIPPSARARNRARTANASNRGRVSAWPHALRALRLCLLALVLIVVLVQVAQTRPAQQAWLALRTGPLGSFLLPMPTPKPTAKPTRPPAPPPGSAQVVGIIQSVFGSYANAATAVARCESSLNPAAVNPTSIGGSHAAGLFQILYPSTWRTTAQASNSPYDAQANTLAAYQIFKRDGYSWREWSCKP